MLIEMKIFTILTFCSTTIPFHSFTYTSHLIVKQHDVLEKCLRCCNNVFIYDIGYFDKYTSTLLDIILSHLSHLKYKTPSMIRLSYPFSQK